ncbi:hypothetical protein [Rhizobium herbae]
MRTRVDARKTTVQVQFGDREIIRVEIGHHDKGEKQRIEYDQFRPNNKAKVVCQLPSRTA